MDPKGLLHIPLTDLKIQFFKKIKEIEERLGDPKVTLDSFIVSNTPSHTMRMLWGIDKDAMTARHILFQEEDAETYIQSLLETVVVNNRRTVATR